MLCTCLDGTKVETYHLTFQLWVVARIDSLKYLFEKPTLSGRLSRWLILLVEFDLKYVARKTIKGSVASAFCVEIPIEGGGGTVKRIFRMRIFWMLS